MITCVVPTYNQSRFLKRAIDSILAQTYRDFELIVVNDGSTDDTANILAGYDDPRMQVWHKPNGGTGTALNMGFQWARGEFETWFASDNVMYPNNFESLLDGIGDADFVYSDCDITSFRTQKEDRYSIAFNSYAYDAERCLSKDWYFGLFWLWRRELRLKSLASFMPNPNEDLDMVLRFEEHGVFKRIGNVGGLVDLHKDCMSEVLSHETFGGRYTEAIRASARVRRAIP